MYKIVGIEVVALAAGIVRQSEGLKTMIRTIALSAVLMSLTQVGLAQSDNGQNAAAVPGGHEAMHQRLEAYVAAFNKQDAVAVAAFWSPDCVSTAEDSGQRIEGREALQQHFAAFFKEAPGARLAGQITAIQLVRPDVAAIEGRTTLAVSDAEPVVSVFAATLVKDEKEWLIANAREHDLPPATSPHEALRDLEWLIGTWQDQAEDAGGHNGSLVTEPDLPDPLVHRPVRGRGTAGYADHWLGSVEPTDPHVDLPFGRLVRARNRNEARPSLDAEDVADSQRWSHRGRDPGHYSGR
ncbi:MAG: SgcJ/EcaC family oxidoreductase [Pirellulaceae bacterium]|nr:SgcJ/EcaC family oxidoreductase [Pirellulaceae bacterium]